MNGRHWQTVILLKASWWYAVPLRWLHILPHTHIHIHTYCVAVASYTIRTTLGSMLSVDPHAVLGPSVQAAVCVPCGLATYLSAAPSSSCRLVSVSPSLVLHSH